LNIPAMFRSPGPDGTAAQLPVTSSTFDPLPAPPPPPPEPPPPPDPPPPPLCTVTLTVVEVAVLPAPSNALADSAWRPGASRPLAIEKLQGDAVSSLIIEPSANRSTLATVPLLSLADTVTVNADGTVAPSSGEVICTCGGIMSPPP